MARYNGRLHCIVGVLPTCYKRKAATYFYPPGGTGPNIQNKIYLFTQQINQSLLYAKGSLGRQINQYNHGNINQIMSIIIIGNIILHLCNTLQKYIQIFFSIEMQPYHSIFSVIFNSSLLCIV